MSDCRALVLAVALWSLAAISQARDPYISEFHYDNAGADVGEFIELAGPAGTELTGYELVLYNGNGG
ncbi:MAG: hypothetical protein AAGG11_20740, partial [Pseudomonadota bacterium]